MNIKHKKIYIFAAFVLGIFLLGNTSFGATILFPPQGGTGKGSAVAGDVGKLLKISDDSPFTYSYASIDPLVVTSLTVTNNISVGGSISTPISIVSSGNITGANITDSALTAGRVTFAGTAGILTDDSDMTFATDTLTVTKLGATTLTGTIAGGGNQINNVIIGTTTPLAGAFTTLSATGQITSTLAIGTAPLVITSTTLVPNLYVQRAVLADSASAVAASALTGTTLASNVVTSSLTTIGTLVAGAVPASLVTTGTFGTGAYVMDTSLTVPLINGSSAANGDITINGTSNATKTTSYVILQETGGNVGIGTTAPTHILDISSANPRPTLTASTGANPAYWTVLNTTGVTYMGLESSSAGSEFPGSLAYASVFGSGGARATQFLTDGTVRMTIAPTTGNVGIGTTAPDRALEINSATGINLRLTYNDSNGSAANYADLLTSSSGDLTITPSGGDIVFPTAVAVTHTGSANNRAKENQIIYGATTDAATAVELTTNGSAGSGATNRICVPADTTMSIVLNIAVKQSASANAKQMLRQVVITNNGGTTALNGSVVALGTDTGDAGLTTVTTTITANNTDDCLKVEVNGVIATNLRYSAFVVSTEVLYP